MDKLTKEQALAITGFTGVMVTTTFSEFHNDVEKRLGRSIWTHEFASESLTQEIKEAYREDFMSMIDMGDEDQ